MSESVQWALILPALMLCVLGIVQAGIYLHARTLVTSAAAAAADAEAALDAPQGAGQAAAERVAGTSVTSLSLAVERGVSEVHVEVSARVPLIADIGPSVVVGRATASRERIPR